MPAARPSNIPHRPEARLLIEDLAYGGDGVGRSEGRVWFVPGTIPGERVVARAREVRRDFVRADLVEILEPSPSRVSPRCPYFGSCGGCVYQHIDYPSQLARKREQVEAALLRIGKIADAPVAPTIPSPLQYGYRNRITVHITNGVTGFHRAGGRGLVDVARCEIADESINRELARFRSMRPFDGHRTLRATGTRPEGFRQTNDAVADLLREHIASLLDKGGNWLVDAFCGSGFFAFPLSGKFARVTGIDWSEPAISRALETPSQGVEFIRGAVEDILPELLASSPEPPDAILLDPPSEGLNSAIANLLCSRPPSGMLVYVSCDPATFARDARALSSAYNVAAVTPFDMFPQTAGIEIAAVLRPSRHP